MSDDLKEEYLITRKQRFGSSGKRATGSADKKSWLVELRNWVLTTLALFIIMSMLNIFVFNISTVKGMSMQPTLWEGEKLIINKISMSFTGPKRGEVIVLHDPSMGKGRKDYLVKRVIGIPGDTVEVRDHNVYVNGKMIEEPYIDTPMEDSDFAPVTVENDSYFVLGDNRHAGASKDSRYFGSVPQERIVGKAVYIWWPFTKLNSL